MAFKPIVVFYEAKNFTTGLSDIKGQVYVDQVAKAVGGSAISFAALDATNSPGVYYAVISPAQQLTWSAVNGSVIEVHVDSASKPAPSDIKYIVTSVYTDDLETHLTSQDSTLSTINSNVSTIKSDVEDGTTGLAAIKSAINSLSSQVSSIQNNTNFECYIPENGFIKPTTGNTVYRIPINICNESGSVADADGNSIIVSVANVAGTDRGSILTGYSLGTAPAVRDAAGKYHIDLTIPSTQTEEELVFTFAYTMNSVAYNKQRGALVVNNVQADGFALQSTLLDVQDDVDNIETIVTNGTYGLAALESLLTNGTYGLSAIETSVTANNTLLTDSTYGLAAIKSEIVTNVEGSGFTVGTDSLHAISAYLIANLYNGGRVI